MKFGKIFKKTHSNDHNLIGAMEEIIEAKANLKRRKEYSPFTAFPNVSSVRIEVSPWDELFKEYGMKRRSSSGTMHYIRYTNKDLNRFKLRCIMRLRKARDNGNHRVFGGIAMFLCKRSKIFFLDALRHCNIKFHRNMKMYDILKLYKEFRAIAEASKFFQSKYMNKVQREVRVIDNTIITKDLRTTLNKYIDFKRVYIEKKDSGRPLGVPTLVWRVYLHLINQFLVLGLEHKVHKEQHGFRPFKGTLTAGVEILKIVKEYNYIYEFDYKSFFPNLDIHAISHVLRCHNVTEEGVDLIERINNSVPKLPEELKLDESDTEINSEFIEHIRGERAENNEADLGMLGEYGEDGVVKGVPQGAPTSPFLSILVLDGAVERLRRRFKGMKFVRYADDGVIFSNKPIDLKKLRTDFMDMANIEYSLPKSGYVKEAGEGVKSLKFLGLLYDGTTDKLRAETRNGSKLLMDKEELIKRFNARESDYPEDDTAFSWESFIYSKIRGYIQSRMYVGDGNLENFLQNFRLNYGKGSGVSEYMAYTKKLSEELIPGLKLSVFNSSSICLKSILEAMKDYEKYNFRTKTYKKKGGGTETSIVKTARKTNPFYNGLNLPGL